MKISNQRNQRSNEILSYVTVPARAAVRCFGANPWGASSSCLVTVCERGQCVECFFRQHGRSL